VILFEPSPPGTWPERHARPFPELAMTLAYSRVLRSLLACVLMWSLASGAQDANLPNAGPWRTSSDAHGSNIMLEGHDAVAYFTQNAAVKGDPAISTELHGVVWRFASAENRAEFLKDPARYLPQFGGFCSNGINYAIPWGGGGGPDTWRIYRGKLHVFGGQSSRDHFEMDTERNLELSRRYWKDEVAGSWALFQRFKRLVFRVPHYKTGRQLDDEYQAKLAAKTLPVMPGAPQVVPAQ
jgi:YHS domain-containing protein